MSDPHDRLGINGASEIKAHPFFKGIDWKNIKKRSGYFKPLLKSNMDFSNFDQFEEEEEWISSEKPKIRKSKKDDLMFAGFTFKRESENERTHLIKALENLENLKT